MSRLEPNSINRRGLESLIAAGAFDSLNLDNLNIGKWRARLHSGIDTILMHGQRLWDDKVRGQNALFGVSTNCSEIEFELADAVAWSASEISRHEKNSIGFYLSVHPLDEYADIVSNMGALEIERCFTSTAGDSVKTAGIISSVQLRYSKKGNRFCIFRIEDRSGGLKCIAWGEAFSKLSEILKEGELVVVCGKIEVSEGQDTTLIISEAQSLSDAMFANARELRVTVPQRSLSPGYIDDLFAVLSSNPGDCDVYVDFVIDGFYVKLHSQPLRIRGSRHLEKELTFRDCGVDWRL
jgi:DNA polymerase-3 subunit alpha